MLCLRRVVCREGAGGWYAGGGRGIGSREVVGGMLTGRRIGECRQGEGNFKPISFPVKFQIKELAISTLRGMLKIKVTLLMFLSCAFLVFDVSHSVQYLSNRCHIALRQALQCGA